MKNNDHLIKLLNNLLSSCDSVIYVTCQTDNYKISHKMDDIKDYIKEQINILEV